MNALEVIEREAGAPAGLWWGYCERHGWVVLDRDDFRNRPGGQDYHLVRCRDWAGITVSRAEFGEATYQWYRNRIRDLSDQPSGGEELARFQGYLEQFRERRGMLRVTAAEYARRGRAACGEALVNQLRQSVDSLLHARREASGKLVIRECSLAVCRAVDSLRREHQEDPLARDTVEFIIGEKGRSGLRFRNSKAGHSSICWDCHRRRGTRTEVDKRVDPECPLCTWAICPVCGACQDPRFGDCPQNNKRVQRSS